MFKILLSFLFAVPLWGQESVPIGSRSTQPAKLCSDIGGAEECFYLDSSGHGIIGAGTVLNPLSWEHIMQISGGNNAAISLSKTDATASRWDLANFQNNFSIWNGSSQFATVSTTGNVGIGSGAVSAPNRKLEVEHSVDGGALVQFNNLGTGTNSIALELYSGATDATTPVLDVNTGLGAALKVKGTGKTELSVREDGNCGVGNICSQANASLGTILGVNCATATITGSNQAMRVGNVVTFGFSINLAASAPTTNTECYITGIPFRGTAFAGSTKAQGSCSQDDDTGDRRAVFARSGAAELTIKAGGTHPKDTALNTYWCHVIYEAG